MFNSLITLIITLAYLDLLFAKAVVTIVGKLIIAVLNKIIRVIERFTLGDAVVETEESSDSVYVCDAETVDE